MLLLTQAEGTKHMQWVLQPISAFFPSYSVSKHASSFLSSSTCIFQLNGSGQDLYTASEQLNRGCMDL